MKTIRDAVHGDIEVDHELLSILDTPAMQRLRGIKQLGMSHLVYPSAVHTRFEHSLGTLWITRRLLDGLAARGHHIDSGARRIAMLAAVLHDVTHFPFGHTFEDERRLFVRHDRDTRRLDYFLDSPGIRGGLAKSGLAKEVRAVLADEPNVPSFLRGIVKGTICADLLDYLRRDALFCGLRLDYDERLYRYFTLVDGQLALRLYKGGGLRRDALSELVHLLQIRYALTERVYYHHAKVVAGAMVSRAVELALEQGLLSMDELHELRDDSLLDRLTVRAERDPGIAGILTDLGARRLYQRVYTLTAAGFGRPGLTSGEQDALARDYHLDLPRRRAAERQIADSLGIPEAEVIVYCPDPDMSLKEADVLVEVSPDRVQILSELGHPDITALTEKHRGLWKFYVCLRRTRATLADRAASICAEHFGHPEQRLANT